MAESKKGNDIIGIVKCRALLLEYANEKAAEGKKRLADNVRFAVGEMQNPKIVECAKIILTDGISASEAFAIGMLTAIGSLNE